MKSYKYESEKHIQHSFGNVTIKQWKLMSIVKVYNCLNYFTLLLGSKFTYILCHASKILVFLGQDIWDCQTINWYNTRMHIACANESVGILVLISYLCLRIFIFIVFLDNKSHFSEYVLALYLLAAHYLINELYLTIGGKMNFLILMLITSILLLKTEWTQLFQWSTSYWSIR